VTDPTQQGLVDPPLDSAASLSLGEIASLALKAARGSGLSWGESEEVGAAVRWLVARGLPGPDALALELTEIDGRIDHFRPVRDGSTWRSKSAAHSPLLLGIALSDHMAADSELTLGAVLHPLLVIPFLSAAAADLGLSLTMAADGEVHVAFEAYSVSSPDWRAVSGKLLGENISLRIGADEQSNVLQPAGERLAIASDTLSILQALAQRTYAPETEISRTRGAGSEQSDAD